MKKFAAFVLALVLAVGLVACGSKGEENPPVNDDRFFDAEVVEIRDGTALVKPIGGKDAPLEGEVVISTNAKQVPEMQAGTRIRVMFGGEIAETDPPQIDVVFAIYLLDEIEQ